jgi:hypothetical protein
MNVTIQATNNFPQRTVRIKDILPGKMFIRDGKLHQMLSYSDSSRYCACLTDGTVITAGMIGLAEIPEKHLLNEISFKMEL